MKTLYRIEHKDGLGMWNTKCNNGFPLVTYLSNRVIAELPMPHNDIYQTNGTNWYSAADSLEMMDFWFKKEDIQELVNMGFQCYEIVCTEWKHHDQEIIYTKESELSRKNVTEMFV